MMTLSLSSSSDLNVVSTLFDVDLTEVGEKSVETRNVSLDIFYFRTLARLRRPMS